MTDNPTPLVAIETRYLGPTNHNGWRIVAETCNGNRLVAQFDYDCSDYEAHKRVAMQLADRMKWTGTVWHGGVTKAGYVFVQVFA